MSVLDKELIMMEKVVILFKTCKVNSLSTWGFKEPAASLKMDPRNKLYLK